MGAVAVRSGGTVVADVGSVSVVNAVGVVVGLVVGPAPASADRINRDGDDEEQHGADDSGRVERDADAGVALLRGSSGPQRHDGKDEGCDGAGEAEEGTAATEQCDDGEHEREHTAIPEWSSSGGDW